MRAPRRAESKDTIRKTHTRARAKLLNVPCRPPRKLVWRALSSCVLTISLPSNAMLQLQPYSNPKRYSYGRGQLAPRFVCNAVWPGTICLTASYVRRMHTYLSRTIACAFKDCRSKTVGRRRANIRGDLFGCRRLFRRRLRDQQFANNHDAQPFYGTCCSAYSNTLAPQRLKLSSNYVM